MNRYEISLAQPLPGTGLAGPVPRLGGAVGKAETGMLSFHEQKAQHPAYGGNHCYG